MRSAHSDPNSGEKREHEKVTPFSLPALRHARDRKKNGEKESRGFKKRNKNKTKTGNVQSQTHAHMFFPVSRFHLLVHDFHFSD
jgi:hypothetical protein